MVTVEYLVTDVTLESLIVFVCENMSSVGTSLLVELVTHLRKHDSILW